jgi:hypothetical protein
MTVSLKINKIYSGKINLDEPTFAILNSRISGKTAEAELSRRG